MSVCQLENRLCDVRTKWILKAKSVSVFQSFRLSLMTELTLSTLESKLS